MPESAKLDIQEFDKTASIGDIAVNVTYVTLDAERGPIGVNEDIIDSLPMFERIYGKIKSDLSNKDSYNKAARAITSGTALRICNVKHYSDITDASTLTAEKAVMDSTTLTSFGTLLSAGNTVKATIGDLEISQAFVTSHTNTLDLLLSKILSNTNIKYYYGVTVLKAKRYGNSILIITSLSYYSFTITVTGGSAVVVNTTTRNAIVNINGDPVFGFEPKYPGAKYNEAYVEILPSTSGKGYAFNILIGLGTLIELYEDITITDNGVGKNFLKAIEDGSEILKPVYLEPDTFGYYPFPLPTYFGFVDGTDGGQIVASDIIGNSESKLGLYGADGYSDIYSITNFLELEDLVPVHQAAATYVKNAKKFQYLCYLPGSTRAEVISYKDTLNIDTSFVEYYSDGLKLSFYNSALQTTDTVGCIGDVAGISAKSAVVYGPWYSIANKTRGSLSNVLAVGNKWGDNLNDLDILARNQINVVTRKNGVIMIWGNFTAQLDYSLLSFRSIRRCITYISKSLGPTLELFLEEPNDIPTWKAIYQAVYPKMEAIKNARGIFDYTWMGDQFADSMDKLVVNNYPDVQLGKYKVELEVFPENSLQKFTLDLTIEKGTITLSETN